MDTNFQVNQLDQANLITPYFEDMDRLASINMNNTENLFEDIKTKKTNSTGYMTPNRSMTSDILDQLMFTENVFLDNLNPISTSLNNETNLVQENNLLESNRENNLNQRIANFKVNEYILKEQQVLGVTDKINFGKIPFKNMINNLSSISDNIEKYFILSRKFVEKYRKFDKLQVSSKIYK